MTRKKTTKVKKEPGPFDADAQAIHDWVSSEYESYLNQFDVRLQLAQQRAESYAAAPTELVNAFLNGTPRHAADDQPTPK